MFTKGQNVERYDMSDSENYGSVNYIIYLFIYLFEFRFERLTKVTLIVRPTNTVPIKKN